jgi:dTDP-glucose 4,6-dehydratase
VSDTIDGIIRLGLAKYADPVNIGNPHEITILELAETIQRVVGKRPGIDFRPRPADDPMVRRPEISTARSVLGWEPVVDLETGLKSALNWFAR